MTINIIDRFQRKPSIDGVNKKRDWHFLALKTKTTKDLTFLCKTAIDPKTLRMIVHDNLVFKSNTKIPRHLFTSSMNSRNQERCKKVLRYLKNRRFTFKILSDQIFTIDSVLICWNGRYLVDVKCIFWVKHSARVMIVDIVTFDGKKCPVFFLQAWKNGKCWCLLQGFVFIFCYDCHRETMRIFYHYQQSNDFWSADSWLSTVWTWSSHTTPIPTLILSHFPSRRYKLVYSKTFSQILKHWDFVEVVIENAMSHIFLLFMDIIKVIFLNFY